MFNLNFVIMSKSNEAVDPEKVKKWIKFAIAVLSALLGAFAESKTSILSSLIG